MKRLSVAIAEEQDGLRQRLAKLLATRADIALRCQASNGKEARRVVKRVKPHILLLSMTLPEVGGIEILPIIRQESPTTKVIMFLPFSDDESAAAAIRGGARGYFLKNAFLSPLVKAIKAVHAGEVWAEKNIVTKLLTELSSLFESQRSASASLSLSLTAKELWVASLVAVGLPNSDIGRMLSIGEKAVKAHLTKIFRKLGVSNRVQLAHLCWRALPFHSVGEDR